MTVLRSQEGQTLQVLSDRVCIKLKSASSANRMAVMSVEVPPGGFVPPHTHDKEEESYFMLEGTMTMQLDNQEWMLEPGDFVHVPANTIHGYSNHSDQSIRFLAWSVGGAVDEFFTEMSENIQTMPDDLPKMPAILEKYGIQMIDPA
ncbi:quercetin 2,3-dioxygenase [Oscillatoria sp. FACHB-1407]|uniref:quercetin 2,3-dioxygenase n=1 Tax=Oscillatoria sp. FACHB-1407 TaxID=2692847 RepID=UPI0016863918|nr:quercetin 2,3-dioxygenase [Oscillatoria sp. FACHB-1407]MBD2460811.1 quercetin 2,3-dioxygenase [Oscillatoria sp. FACHB-1407]